PATPWPPNHLPADGTRPQPGLTEAQSSAWVRDMFARVAPRYDLLNRLLTLQIDRLWRWRTARRLAPGLSPQSRVLDLCCGTGDLLAALEHATPARYLGADFCLPMLVRTRAKSPAPLIEADGLKLPLRDASLHLITIGFGFRNFVNYRAALTELFRVLAPGGRLAILEFTRPPYALVRAWMAFWNRFVLHPLGHLLSGQQDAYQYLPDSVARFPDAPSLAQLMRDSGFPHVEFSYFDLGIVALHIATKPL
ncbi:MAG: ubiquinone/menaquinone biosynthesis methyltransferase, partial [Acidobacteriota bacterium]